MSRPKLLDELFGALVESQIVEPTFVVDYPVELSPLAKPKRGNPALTERFELFARGQGAGECVQRAERSDRSAPAVRGAGAPARRGRPRGERGGRGLSARDGIRHAADGRRRHRHRPAVHVSHRYAEHPRRDPLSDDAPRMSKPRAGHRVALSAQPARIEAAVADQCDRDRRRGGRRERAHRHHGRDDGSAERPARQDPDREPGRSRAELRLRHGDEGLAAGAREGDERAGCRGGRAVRAHEGARRRGAQVQRRRVRDGHRARRRGRACR